MRRTTRAGRDAVNGGEPVGTGGRVRAVSDGAAARPLNPRRWADVPNRSIADLVATCAVRAPDELFVLPARGAGGPHGRAQDRPTTVLGLGESAVGLWVDGDGLVNRVRTEDIIAFEDRSEHGEGVLTVAGGSGRVVLRYDLTARSAMRRALAHGRRRFDVTGQPVPDITDGTTQGSVSWARAAWTSPLDPDRARAAVVRRQSGASWRARRYWVTLLVTGRELIVLRDTAPRAHDERRIDALYVARRGIDRIETGAETWRIHAADAVLEARLGSVLAAAAASALATALPLEPALGEPRVDTGGSGTPE